MSRTISEIKDELLSLPEEVREYLIDELSASLRSSDEISEAWMREIQRRREEILRGEVELLNEDEVFEDIEARLR